jgi:very-short-patch-repair endonuclease
MDISGAFRGSAAVAAGALSRGELAGPRFRRLFPDVYAPAELAVDLAARSRAAYLLVEPHGVLAGYSAAELLGASCGPENAPAEVLCPRSRRRLPGLIVHTDALTADETVVQAGLRMTAPARTAFDLARWQPLVEGVTAVDALAHRFPFDLDEVRALRSRHLGAHGGRRIERVLSLTDRRSESPMESRTRIALVLGGLSPQVQYRILVGGLRVRLDLAFPQVLLAVEFDGGHHRTAEQARRDLHREAALAAAGWKVLRFDAGTVFRRPDVIVARTRLELARRASKIADSARSRAFRSA